jgi:serine O-acetyltransferase
MVIPPAHQVFQLRDEYAAATDTAARTEIVRQYRQLMHEFGSSIHLGTKFESVPFFPQGPYSIFISRGAVIGKNCILFQQVTIGSNYVLGSRTIGSPRLGGNVYVDAGARIIGSVRIGNDVIIGANATVVQDIPANSVVVGNHSLIISRDTVDARYFSRHEELGWAYYQDGTWQRDLTEKEISMLSAADRS